MIDQLRDVTEILHQEQLKLDYPSGLVPVRKRIRGRSFFPGGSGVLPGPLEKGNRQIPPGGVMVVGRDFDTEENHALAVSAGEELIDGTWRNILALLDQAGISPASCFFTNAYMGLRRDSSMSSNMGQATGHRSRCFTQECQRFFTRQVQLVRPKLILCLGPAVARFMRGCAGLPASWNSESIKEIDRSEPGPLVGDAPFLDDGSISATFAVLVHPSMRQANVWRRTYVGLNGKDAELALIEASLKKAFATSR